MIENNQPWQSLPASYHQEREIDKLSHSVIRVIVELMTSDWNESNSYQWQTDKFLNKVHSYNHQNEFKVTVAMFISFVCNKFNVNSWNGKQQVNKKKNKQTKINSSMWKRQILFTRNKEKIEPCFDFFSSANLWRKNCFFYTNYKHKKEKKNIFEIQSFLFGWVMLVSNLIRKQSFLINKGSIDPKGMRALWWQKKFRVWQIEHQFC